MPENGEMTEQSRGAEKKTVVVVRDRKAQCVVMRRAPKNCFVKSSISKIGKLRFRIREQMTQSHDTHHMYQMANLFLFDNDIILLLQQQKHLHFTPSGTLTILHVRWLRTRVLVPDRVSIPALPCTLCVIWENHLTFLHISFFTFK